MFDKNGVQRIANDMCFFDLVCFIEEHPQQYVNFIMEGEFYE